MNLRKHGELANKMITVLTEIIDFDVQNWEPNRLKAWKEIKRLRSHKNVKIIQ